MNHRQEGLRQSTLQCRIGLSKADAISIGTPDHTTSAGYLLDQAGLKGFRINQAQFSDIHANFIINLKEAKANDVFQLILTGRKKVQEKFAVKLQPEIVLLGKFDYN